MAMVMTVTMTLVEKAILEDLVAATKWTSLETKPGLVGKGLKCLQVLESSDNVINIYHNIFVAVVCIMYPHIRVSIGRPKA